MKCYKSKLDDRAINGNQSLMTGPLMASVGQEIHIGVIKNM